MQTTVPISPAEAANRTSKAIRYVVALQELGDPWTDPAVVALMGPEHWEFVARYAGERTPSPATVAVIVTLLRELPKLPADPFARIA
jgi:hypothetical protein